MAKVELKIGSVGISLGDMPKGAEGKGFFREDGFGEISVKALDHVRQGYDIIVVDKHNGVLEYVRNVTQSFLLHDAVILALLAAPVRGNPYEVGFSQLQIDRDNPKFISESTLVFLPGQNNAWVRWNEWDTVAVPVIAGIPITFFKRIHRFWYWGTAGDILNVWMEGNHVIPGWSTRDV